MELQNSQARRPQVDRHRSRSPERATSNTTGLSRARQRREETRCERESEPERQREVAIEYEFANRERWEAEDAAEEERRSSLSLEDKMKEKGQFFMQKLEQHDILGLYLDHTRFTNRLRATCRARPCFEESAGATKSRLINDPYRILAMQNDYRKSKHYYHVQCLDKMVDLVGLTHSKFFIWGEHPGNWGLMVRKWFEHRGCIDLGKIVAYIEAYDSYRECEAESSFDRKCVLRQIMDAERETEVCTCPSLPGAPKQPVLEDYVTVDEEKGDLLGVLAHPRVEDVRPQICLIHKESVVHSVLHFPEKIAPGRTQFTVVDSVVEDSDEDVAATLAGNEASAPSASESTSIIVSVM